MIAYAESSLPSSYLNDTSHMHSYRTSLDDYDYKYARSPSFDSSGSLSRRYGSTFTSAVGSRALPAYTTSSASVYDTPTTRYSSSYDSSSTTLNRRKPPLPYYPTSKYSSAANSPDLRPYRYDRSASSDRSGTNAESYRSAVISAFTSANDDLRRIPSNHVDSISRKFENIVTVSDGYLRTPTVGRVRDRSADYSYGNGVVYPSSSGKYTSASNRYYDDESRDSVGALPLAGNSTTTGGSSLYRSRIAALSVPDVPTFARTQVRHELEDDDDDDDGDYLERRSASRGYSQTSPLATATGKSHAPSTPTPSAQRKTTPPTTVVCNNAGNSSLSGSSSFSRTEPSRSSASSLESSESRRSNDNSLLRTSRSTTIIIDDANQKSGLLGLRNLGNTCFMNSVIQCLSHSRLLREYCLSMSTVQADINSSSRMKGALMKAFCETLADLWALSKSSHVNPDKFKMQIQKFAPRFTGYNQQDAQEFLRYLLQGMHEDINRVQSKTPPLPPLDDNLPDQQKAAECWKRYLRIDDSKIVDIFVGQLKSELKCTHCGHVSTTFDPFWDLSLPLPQERRLGGGQVSLNDCMDAFAKEEILDGDEKPTCESCKVRRRCTKKFLVQKFPSILVLHLKRFSGERYRSRLSTLVDFPTTKFDMTPYASSAKSSVAPKYDLYAVSNHSGTPMMGHYTAYCKHALNGQWYLFDDTRVTQVSENSVVSGEAYVLFYELSSSSSNSAPLSSNYTRL